MKTTNVFLALFILIPPTLSAQSGNNAFFVELGGNAWCYSINFEHHFSEKLMARTGISYVSRSYILPVMLGRVYGSRTRRLEVSGGLVYVNYRARGFDAPTTRQNGLGLTSYVGLRFESPDNPFFFKIGISPYWLIHNDDRINEEHSRYFFPYAGMAVGARF